MNMYVWQPVEVTVGWIVIDIPHRSIHADDGVPESLTNQFASTDFISLRVSATGVVSGWNHGEAAFTVKVVDEGVYTLLDDDGDVFNQIAGYVPKCVPGEYGDYITLKIDTEGRVADWDKFFTPANVRQSFFPVPERQP